MQKKKMTKKKMKKIFKKKKTYRSLQNPWSLELGAWSLKVGAWSLELTRVARLTFPTRENGPFFYFFYEKIFGLSLLGRSCLKTFLMKKKCFKYIADEF